jgi:hypothetical protein
MCFWILLIFFRRPSAGPSPWSIFRLSSCVLEFVLSGKIPLFFSAHIFSSCRGPSCASVCIPVPPVRYFSASILLPPISPGLVRVCTILFLSCMNSPAQNLLRLRLQWAPAGPSGAQSSRQERAPAPSLLVQDTQVSPTLQCS